MMVSDVIFFPDSTIHPRVYGSTGRVLGPCVRDSKLFSLEEAVYKLSGAAAARFGLRDRGIIREGAFADLVVFDADTIGDRATYEQPHQTCAGIQTVLVNGRVIVEQSAPVDSREELRPGRYLKYEP